MDYRNVVTSDGLAKQHIAIKQWTVILQRAWWSLHPSLHAVGLWVSAHRNDADGICRHPWPGLYNNFLSR